MNLFALLVLSGWATGNPGQLAQGRAVYETACLLCHGRDGAGNPDWESEIRILTVPATVIRNVAIA